LERKGYDLPPDDSVQTTKCPEVIVMIKAKDPVCGMAVDTKNPPAQTQYKDRTYYFCALGCKMMFEENPERFVAAPKGDRFPEQAAE
jgi:YHS domain-containing protein